MKTSKIYAIGFIIVSSVIMTGILIAGLILGVL